MARSIPMYTTDVDPTDPQARIENAWLVWADSRPVRNALAATIDDLETYARDQGADAVLGLRIVSSEANDYQILGTAVVKAR
ncbi:hypothetical protein [Planomonospora sp. ID82291]|uniref:hypothetical protein n=1 Tax=Planomonospora sp. ID82291 TaxID=2738136 RepID=UPI0018C3E7BB|nr:hypothetical protein [Planomonospora sp. ID82291]MBG0819079.1 hypothetical protein [Planomonospora sp. ID82291]